jgi:5-dehydro-2-deoxygluconokinase
VFDVLTMGRIGVDLYPHQIGVPLAEVETFGKFLGGSPTNVAVAAARLGHRSAVITKVGDDGFGEYARLALRRFGVDDRFVETDPTLRTPLVFPEIYPPDHFPLLFYREPKAPDINITMEEIDLDAVSGAKIFWTTGTGLSDEPSRTTTLGALEARGRRRNTIHDLDFRPMFWDSVDEAREYQRQAVTRATIVVGNREECAVAIGDVDPSEQAERLLALGLEWAIVKLGPEGVLVAWRDGMETVAPIKVEVVNGLGAGDAFGGALCHGLLLGWGPVETVTFANAAGAYVATQLACADAMPSEDQIWEMLR